MMRGIVTSVNNIRKQVYAEIAKLAYNYDGKSFKGIDEIPYKIVPGEISKYRESVFLERAIVRERMRVAMGLSVRSAEEYGPVYAGAEEATKPEKYYQPPLINVIKFACHQCPDNIMMVTDACQGCLAQPCKEVCPKDAVSFDFSGKQSKIDTSKCIKCEKCAKACQYGAILHLQRPCAKACGMNAITSDAYGRAEINQEKCVSCGMCLANCPFGAIVDKAQIFQTIQAIKDKDIPVYAAIAPAVYGQFGNNLTPGKIRTAFRALGFEDVIEVAIGADLCTLEEAKDFVENVPSNLQFMATSCCPAWAVMAKKLFPDFKKNISMALTPMVLTARLIKKQHPNCKIAFIGPCAAKKLEASRREIKSDVDFVLTFEEVMGMFAAKEVNFDELKESGSMHGATADGRGFAVSGGVAQAVVNCIKKLYPEKENINVVCADGLDNCKKMLALAKTGKYNGYLLEGMACPGGCVAGAGTEVSSQKTSQEIKKRMEESTYKHAYESGYFNYLKSLESETPNIT